MSTPGALPFAAVGDGGCAVIAEVAQAHDGSLGTAHAYIDLVADCGADAVKFQTHIAAAESTPSEPWRVRFSPQDETRYEYWQRMEFTEAQWKGLKEHADERGLLFLSSAFSVEAVELLERIGVTAWKVASGEVRSVELLDRMVAHGAPVIMSSGMSSWDEIGAAVERCRAAGSPVVLLQCNTAYPCPPEKIGLNVLAEMRERFGCPVGLSDHSGTIFPGLAAVALGASVLEVHVTFSRSSFGPDVPASLTGDELAELVRGVRFLGTALAHPIDKDAEAEAMAPMRALFTKSVVARHDLPAGHVLTGDDLAAKKPGTGIPSARLPELVGRRLARPVAADELLSDDDLLPAEVPA